MKEYQPVRLPRDVYQLIKQLAAESNRTIGGQIAELAKREEERRNPYHPITITASTEQPAEASK